MGHQLNQSFSTVANTSSNTATTTTTAENALFRTAFASTLGVVFIISTCASFFVCHVIKKYKLMERTVWIYFFCFATCDLCGSLLSIPLTLTAVVYQPVLDILFLCNISGVVIMFFGNWSVMTAAMISIHRCIQIVNPLKSLTRKVHRDVIAYLLISLTLSVFLSLSPVVGFSQYTHIEGRPWCILHSKHDLMNMIYWCIVIVFSICLPLILMIVSSIWVCCMHYRRRSLQLFIQYIARLHEGMKPDEKKLTNTMAIVIVSFLCTWSPAIMYIFFEVTGTPFPSWGGHLVYLLRYSRGIINPIIFTARHHYFKKEIRHFVLRCCRKKRNQIKRSIISEI